MLQTGIILLCSFGYIGLLFAIAYFGDRAAETGRSIISNPYIYTLSLAVYCTAWTFYGSVGRAAATGPGFLPIYLGPTLMMSLGWMVLRKIIRISKANRITSIADFIASRYGKSSVLGGMVTVMAVLGVVPYIALQLKAISASYLLVNQYPQVGLAHILMNIPVFQDTAFYISLMLAVFAILFGTRHLEATERHEGIVAAIAFESIVKLAAFVAVSIFVTYGIYGGIRDIFSRAGAVDTIRRLYTMDANIATYTGWSMYIVVSMLAVILLPRQFQVAVVENVDEKHLNKAVWLFPLYLLAINVFVLPVAFGGLLRFVPGSVDPDTFVLSLPMIQRHQALAMFVFIGGLSAATGMVIVETVALSTMISNDLIMPILLRLPYPVFSGGTELPSLLLAIRRGSIALILLMGYAYFHFIAKFLTLVSIGMISFTAVAQFGPAIIGGIFWKRATRAGALLGLIAGFSIWIYTLFLPSLAEAGLFSQLFVLEGPAGTSLLKPYALFGLDIGLTPSDRIAHAIFWSLLLNIAGYVGGSLFSRPSALEHTQAALFVDVLSDTGVVDRSTLWRGKASIPDLEHLLTRFLGEQRTSAVLKQFAQKHRIARVADIPADANLVTYIEQLLAGVVGSASARVLVSSVAKEEPIGIREVMDILDETRQAIAHSRRLEKLTVELKAANERLQELDGLKNEFISTVTHELRTPLTSIRSISEILNENSDIDPEKRRQFSRIILKESERLSRLITQVLDFQKIDSGLMDWQMRPLNFKEVIDDALQATRQFISDNRIELQISLADNLPELNGDRDRLIQVMVNLISNAVKFCRQPGGQIAIRGYVQDGNLTVEVQDNGVGIDPKDQKIIFEKFRQVKDTTRGRPQGSGLGLAITKSIIDHHGGRIWVVSKPPYGSTFIFTLPLQTDIGRQST